MTCFVTGTDTGIGKTLTAAAIVLATNSYYWKPIQSGVSEEMADVMRVQQLTNLSQQHFLPSTYNLEASLSPNQAAELQTISLDISKCQLPNTSQPLIVEGAGGVFVPINETVYMIDLMVQLGLPIVVVARGTLGTINHTLLTIAALRHRGLIIKGIVFSGELKPHNQRDIEKYGQVKVLFHIPFFPLLTPEIFQTWVRQEQQPIQQSFL
jgi:dethiobiotin synthase